MRRIGKRNIQIGDYHIREARTATLQPESAVWRVYFKQALEPMSEHVTRAEAVKAAERYKAGDERRNRAFHQHRTEG